MCKRQPVVLAEWSSGYATRTAFTQKCRSGGKDSTLSKTVFDYLCGPIIKTADFALQHNMIMMSQSHTSFL